MLNSYRPISNLLLILALLAQTSCSGRRDLVAVLCRDGQQIVRVYSDKSYDVVGQASPAGRICSLALDCNPKSLFIFNPNITQGENVELQRMGMQYDLDYVNNGNFSYAITKFENRNILMYAVEYTQDSGLIKYYSDKSGYVEICFGSVRI